MRRQTDRSLELLNVTLTIEEWVHILQRVEDDDFYHSDKVAQVAVGKLRGVLVQSGITDEVEWEICALR